MLFHQVRFVLVCPVMLACPPIYVRKVRIVMSSD